MTLPSEEIKEKLDLVQFLKGYLELKPAGKNFKALCPFHSEKTPSFIVSPEREMWHCFGCGEGGDIFRFVMKYDNLEFYEALKVLAEKAGIELRRLSPADQKQFGVLYDINKVAADFFRENLKISNRARAYLNERGLKKETAEEFEIGFAPQEWDELTLYLINKGFEMDDVVRSGLALKTERGKYVDRFRGRIMFPIHNHFGKVVGFSGRILPELESEAVGKYVNSPETPIFNKSRLLYGFSKTKNAIRETGTVLLVEGQMDFLMAWQDGVKNVVATSGTALTPDHLRTLRRVADKIILGFDNDEAGLLAAERSIDLAGANDFNVYVLPFGEGELKDPAELAKTSPGKLAELIGRARRAIQHYFNRYLQGDDFDKQKANLRLILGKIKSLWSPIEKSYWIRELSHLTNIPEKQLMEEMEKLTLEAPREITEPREILRRNLTRSELIAERLLSLINAREDFRPTVEPYLEYMPPKYRLVYESVHGAPVQDPEVKEIMDIVSISGYEFGPREEKRVSDELNDLLRELQLEYLNSVKGEIGKFISEAEALESQGELLARLKEFDDVSRKIQYIKNEKKI
ncbi:MAG: DNA primase [Candidatus Colwellbacteria bacterium]|nr:DNA primase [Candidatus Colwellbacteria bacterium]